VLELQPLGELLVTLLILILEVAEQPAAITDHFEKAAAGVVVLFMFLQVFGNSLDLLAQDSYLHFR